MTSLPSTDQASLTVLATVAAAGIALAACSDDAQPRGTDGPREPSAGVSGRVGGSPSEGAGVDGNPVSGGAGVTGGSTSGGAGGSQDFGGTPGSGETGGAGGGAGNGGEAGSEPAGMAGEGGVPPSGGSGSGGFPTVTDFAEPGPFAPTETSGGPACTIHRPADDELGGPDKNLKHPVITWGNGTGATPGVYEGVLRHWATHGFIVTASNSTNTGDAVEMLACLEWILEQDSVSGPYLGRVDPNKLGASGHSQGGGGTLMIGRDVRIIATAPLQPYILGGLGGFQSSSITEQQGPMFLMSGSDDIIATPSANQAPVFEETNVPVFWGNLEGATHTGTAIGSIGGYRGPATAWFRLHLMGDESARGLFYGPDCGLCTDASWNVERRGIQ
jgi:hypothetical protein